MPLVARRKAAVVLMHRRGRPEERYAGPAYENVVEDVRRFLLDRAAACQTAGVERENIALDPGLGFGKKVEEELALIAGTTRLAETGYPVLIGCSRKSFIGRLTGVEKPADRDPASTFLAVEAVRRGASIVRVHNVVATRQVLTMASQLARYE